MTRPNSLKAWLSLGSFLLLCLPQTGMSQAKSLLVCPFYNGVSREFKGQYQGFTSELDQFQPHLFLELRNSKALSVRVQTGSQSLVLRKGFSRLQIVQECADSVAVLVKRRGKKLPEYLLVGWLTDDTSVVAYADAWLFRVKQDTSRHGTIPDSSYALDSELHSEGSQRDAYVQGKTLSEYLIQDMVLQLEAAVDDRIRVLVAPFVFHGSGPEFNQLGGMIAALIRNRLSISQRIRVIEGDTTQLVRSPAEGNTGSGIRRWTIPELGKRESAKYIVNGSYYHQGSAVGIEASHIDRETGHAVLSKSILIDPFTGASFYEQANLLGDEVRRAIELDYDVKMRQRRLTMAVVALPPYPNTRENRNISVGLAECVARMVRGTKARAGWQLIVGSDSAKLEHFAQVETEKAVMGREFNSQYLLLIRCERPVNNFNVSIELADVRNPNRQSQPENAFDVPMGDLNDTIHALTLRLLHQPTALPLAVDSLTSTSVSGIIYFPPPVSVAVVPLPPYPNTLENRGITTDIADLVLTKLLALQTHGSALVVVRTEDHYQDFLEQSNLNLDSVAASIPARYLWTIDYKELGFERHVSVSLINATNPFEPPLLRRFTIDHIDNLNDYLRPAVRPIFNQLAPEANTAAIDETPHRIESSSLRVRAKVMGFLPKYTDILPIYHTSFELTGIYHMRPWQFELSAAYDLGKHRQNPDRLMYARYVTIAGRYNIPLGFPRDLRFYLGAGFALINVAKVQNDEGIQKIAGGNIISVGLELPLSRYFAMDLNGGYLFQWGSLDLGGTEKGFLTSFSIGIGVVVRVR